MAGPDAVTPTELSPEWDITLTDGTDSVGFVLVDGQGRANPRAIQRTPIQRSAIITSQGSTQFDNLDWPHRSIPQSDWSGGRGSLVFDNDASRYYDGNNCDTSLEGKVILGPLATTGSVSFSGGGTETPGIFFEYKGATYFVTSPLDGSASALFVNGDRGLADSNSSDKTYLNDSTKSWTTNAWVGAIARITAGPGVEEKQNWRVITSNTSTALAVSPDWEVAHTTDTEYVITKTNTWTSIVTTPLFLDKVTDVAVAGDWVYFSYEGDASGSYIQRYREYNNGSFWAYGAATEGSSFWADNILSTSNADGSWTLWGTSNTGKVGGESGARHRQIWKASVPPKWGGLYSDEGIVIPTDKPWDKRSISNALQTLQEGSTNIVTQPGFTTGLMAVDDLDEPVDITGGNTLACLLYASDNRTSGDLQLKYDDVSDLGDSLAPAKVLASRWYSPTYCYYHNGTDYTTVSMANAIDGLSGTAADINSMATTHAIYIGYSAPYSGLYIDLTNVNDNTSLIDFTYHAGNAFSSITFTDNTTNVGFGPATLHQDGSIPFSVPDDWKPSIVNDVEAYWVRLTVSATLDSTVSIAQIQVCAYDQDIPNLYDGNQDTYDKFTCRSTDFMYIGYSVPFNQINVDMTSSVNVRTATLTGAYFDGNTFSSLTITDNTASGGATLAQDGSITFTIPYNWMPSIIDGTEAYWVRLSPSADLAGHATIDNASLSANTFYVTRNNNVTKDLSALVYGWNWATITLTPELQYPYPDATQVKSIGLNASTTLASKSYVMIDGWHLINTSPKYIPIPTTSRINRLVAYGSSTGAGVNPYIITEDGIYEVQQENGDAIVKLPIGEIGSLTSHNNGYAVCTNDVYLYFNLGRKIERYYNNTLEDIGPDLDEGLPADRQGDVTALVSYPGRVYASIDAGASGYSSILLNKGGGWHEMYRGAVGESIYALHYQAIPGSNTGRLWMAIDDDLVYLPVSTNPDTDTDYRFSSAGYIITGWFYGGMRTIKKVFDSLTIILENSTVGSEYINVSYQTDEDSSWTAISGNYDAIVEKIALASTRPTGRRIRFKIQLNTSSSTITPVLLATTLDMFGVIPVKYQYTFTGRLAELTNEDMQTVNLDGQDERALGYADAAETALAKLDAWADDATVLTLNSRYSVYNGKTVIMTAPAHAPYEIQSGLQAERHLLNITVHDL